MNEKKVENVIIIGGGPAGYTAALYTARANLEPLVIEGFQWGGQLQNTTDVENYPGYPEGIMGPEMMQQFRDQAERFGTRFVTDDDGKVAKVRLRNADSDETEELDIDGAFVAIGHIPKSEIVDGQIDTDENGYVLTQDGSTRTNLGGVFAVGDLVDHTYRQAVTAAGTGCMGALDAEWYLRDTPPAVDDVEAAVAASAAD